MEADRVSAAGAQAVFFHLKLIEEHADRRPFAVEGGDASRIEMRAAAGDDFPVGLVDRPCLFVGALGAERIEDIGNGDDARLDRYLFAGKALRVAGAVPFFMVATDDGGGDARKLGGTVAQDRNADRHMLAHLLDLVRLRVNAVFVVVQC